MYAFRLIYKFNHKGIWIYCQTYFSAFGPHFLQLDRKTLSIAYRFLKAKNPEQRAAVDLDTHYSEVTRFSLIASFTVFQLILSPLAT